MQKTYQQFLFSFYSWYLLILGGEKLNLTSMCTCSKTGWSQTPDSSLPIARSFALPLISFHFFPDRNLFFFFSPSKSRYFGLYPSRKKKVPLTWWLHTTIDLTMERLWLIRWQTEAKENIFQLREEPTSHPGIMSDITLKSIYLPFKIPFPDFSVFMMDIGTLEIAFKAFGFFPATIFHWSFTVHQGLDSDLGYTTADTRAGLFKSIGFVFPKSRCKCALQSSCNCLLFHFNMLLLKKKPKVFSDPKKKRAKWQSIICDFTS